MNNFEYLYSANKKLIVANRHMVECHVRHSERSIDYDVDFKTYETYS